MTEERGLIHLYWGEGKGKTTAAMGLALRGLAAGRRVVIVQFLKGGASGEIPLLESLGAKVLRGKASSRSSRSSGSRQWIRRRVRSGTLTRAARMPGFRRRASSSSRPQASQWFLAVQKPQLR